MLETIRRYNSTITVFTTKDLKGDIKLRLGSSGSIKNMNTLTFDGVDGKEVCRINGSIYSSTNNKYQANGWEISDMHRQAQGTDGWYEFILFKDGSFKVGDIHKSTVNLDNVEMAYSLDAVVINNGEDVCQCASHRKSYFNQRHPRTFWGITADGHYVFCTASGRLTNEAGLLGDEVRSILKEYGCVWGFMNDGGKCSQMMINNKLVNKTVTGTWYPVRNAIFIYECERKSDVSDSSELDQLRFENTELKRIIAKVRELVV